MAEQPKRLAPDVCAYCNEPMDNHKWFMANSLPIMPPVCPTVMGKVA